MSILLLKLDHLFTVLAPDLVVAFVVLEGALSIPSEPDFVQEFMSIKSQLVSLMKSSLLANPSS
jgi:hypothetical protein